MRLTKERQEIRDMRMEILDNQNELWKNHCGKCNKIKNALKNGTLPTYTEEGKKIFWTSDRKNPVCDACPIHYLLLDCGSKLGKLTNYDRALRRV